MWARPSQIPALLWNDYTKLMFRNGFMKIPDAAQGCNISDPNAGFANPLDKLRSLSGDKLSDLRNGMRR